MAGLLRGQSPASDGGVAYRGDAAAFSPNPPATSYAETVSGLSSQEGMQRSYADPHNAPIVNRALSRDGIENDYVRGGEVHTAFQPSPPPVSSRFQQTLVQLHAWSINRKWYIAYPAATVMNGGKHNLGLAERTPQITTRTTGGPGAFLMGARPVFKKVQDVPRFSTAPATYNTKGATG